jgi:hypothetical protein
MQLIDSYLLDAGWLFFAAWSVILASVSVSAFAGDLFPSRARLGLAHHDQSSEPPIRRPTD